MHHLSYSNQKMHEWNKEHPSASTEKSSPRANSTSLSTGSLSTEAKEDLKKTERERESKAETNADAVAPWQKASSMWQKERGSYETPLLAKHLWNYVSTDSFAATAPPPEFQMHLRVMLSMVILLKKIIEDLNKKWLSCGLCVRVGERSRMARHTMRRNHLLSWNALSTPFFDVH